MIQDQSIYTEYMARSLVDTGAESIPNISGGTIPKETQDKIVSMVAMDMIKNGGTPSPALYLQVANQLYPTAAGMKLGAITKTLQVNNIFGLVSPISVNSVISGDTNALKQALAHDMTRIANNLLTFSSTNMTGSFANDIRNTMGNSVMEHLTGSLNGVLNKKGLPIRISNPLGTSVSTILSGPLINQYGVNGVVFSSFPATVRNVLTPHIAKGTVEALIEGKGMILDGGTINLSSAGVNFDTGNFIANFGNMSLADRTKISAETLITATDADIPQKEMERILEALFPTIGAQSQRYDIEKDIADKEIGSTIDPGSNFISSIEELEAEMSRMTRPISEVIVHWSETYSDANLSAAQLTELTGAGDNAYHLIIKRDGALQRGVPMNSVGNHCPTLNHNAYSIGVCLVGGVNVASGDEHFEQLGANSITRSQYNTLYQIFRTFFNQYPGGQALGHMDVDVSQEDPGFDVRDYVYNNFNKVSLYYDPLIQPALAPPDIIAMTVSEGIKLGVTKDPDVIERKF